MPEVPGAGYEPYFTAQPTERPVQLRGVEAPGAAFGENVANALRVFGGTLDKDVGDELSRRAEGLRRLQVEGQMRDLTTQYYQTIAPKEEDFLKRQGNQASQDALNAHVADIGATQAQFMAQARQIGGLYGANQFGSEAASMSRNFIQNATRHSAQQSRIASDSSIDAQIGTIQNLMRSATNDAQIQNYSEQLAKLETQRQGLWGYDDGVRDYKIHQAQSAGVAQSIVGLARRDPEAGIKRAQEALDKGGLTSEAQDALAKVAQGATPAAINNHLRSIYSGHSFDMGNRTYDPDTLVNTIYQMEGHTRGPVIWNPRSRYYGQRALPGGVMPGNLQPWLKEAGMAPMTEEQYANDPNAQRQLMRFKLSQFQTQYGTANDAFSMWFTGKPMSAETLGLRDQNITNAVYLQRANSFLARGASSNQIADVAEEYGNSIRTTMTPEAGEQARQFALSHSRGQKEAQREALFDIKNKFSTWVIQNPNKTYDDFLADPNTADIVQQGMQVDPDYARNWPRIINEHTASLRDRTDEVHFNDLVDMARNKQDQFMDIVPWTDHKLDERAKLWVWNQQKRLHDRGQAVPELNRALTDLTNRYPSEVPDRKVDPDGFKAYQGALYRVLQTFQEEKRDRLTPDDYEHVHHLLMSETASGGLAGILGRTTPFYKADIPQEFVDHALEQDPHKTPDDVANEWWAGRSLELWNKYHGTNAKDRLRRPRPTIPPTQASLQIPVPDSPVRAAVTPQQGPYGLPVPGSAEWTALLERIGKALGPWHMGIQEPEKGKEGS